jgi:hypothetical protein
MAYGIWSEGSGVTNSGTILINGEYTENAIRLNGGQLFQYGVMKVGANWSNNGESGIGIVSHCYNGLPLSDNNGVYCECYDGWTGENCDIEVICEHGWANGSHCVCYDGWSGEYCDKEIVDNDDALIGTTDSVNNDNEIPAILRRRKKNKD